MYFGSVKFFKHLILTVFWGWVISATVLAVVFGIKYAVVSKNSAKVSSPVGADVPVETESSETTAVTEPLPDEVVIPAGATVNDIYKEIINSGFTPYDVLNCVKNNDFEAYSSFAENYYAIEEQGSESVISSDAGQEGAPEYTMLFPDLYADAPLNVTEKDNVVYLTFDDGPSENTLDILTILDKYNIKATFFMSGGSSPEKAQLMKKVADKGHTIGIHSISHDYEKIYGSVDAFLEDMNNTYQSVYSATGVKPQIMRFAGGSVNDFNTEISAELAAEVKRRGFTYYDWNVSGEDAKAGATWTSIYNNVLDGVDNISTGRAIVLLHDSADKYTTVTTVEDIITVLMAKGYTFEPLDNTVKPITF